MDLENLTEIMPGSLFEGELDTYVVRKYLGSGGYSNVFTGRSLSQGRNVVLKLMNRKTDAMLEARMLMQINMLALRNSDHICKIIDIINLPEYSSLGMVLQKGACSLLDYMEANSMTAVDPRYIQPIIYQILTAVCSLNEYEIVHVDIKPENILFKSSTKFYSYTEDGKKKIELGDPQIMLCDFNCSMQFSNMREPRGICQTFHYRSPEVVLGTNDWREIDVFSIGAIMAELASGHLLFDMEEKNEPSPTLQQRAQHLRLFEIELGECPESLLQDSVFEFFSSGEWREYLPPPSACNNTKFQLWRTLALQSKRRKAILEAIDGMLAWPTTRHTAETAMQLPFFTARKNVSPRCHDNMVQIQPHDFVRVNGQLHSDEMYLGEDY